MIDTASHLGLAGDSQGVSFMKRGCGPEMQRLPRFSQRVPLGCCHAPGSPLPSRRLNHAWQVTELRQALRDMLNSKWAVSRLDDAAQRVMTHPPPHKNAAKLLSMHARGAARCPCLRDRVLPCGCLDGVRASRTSARAALFAWLSGSLAPTAPWATPHTAWQDRGVQRSGAV